MPESSGSKRERLVEAAEAEEHNARLVAQSRRERQTRRTIADLKSEIRELHEDVDHLQETIATLEALQVKPRKPKEMRRVRKSKGGKLPSAFVALASDWHTFEVVSARQTGGINEHNGEIGIERAWRWARHLVKMVKREQETCDVQSLVCWLGGDFLVNDGLHYKSERSCDLSPPDEAREIRDLLAQIIGYLRSELDVPRMVLPTSWGNHDRSSLKMVPGHAGDYSHIQPVYRDLAAWFAADSSIEFRIAEAEWQAVDVHGYPLLFHHGHAVRYGGGVGGLAVPLLRHVGRLKSDYAFRTLSIGHHHQRGMYQGGVAFTNGSLVGPNGYSRDLGLPSEAPAQVAYTIDLDRLEIANYYVIWGTDAPRP